MTSLLIALLAAMLAPLFLSSWRTSLLGLCSQGLLMGWMSHRLHPELTVENVVSLIDLVVLRALLAPLLLYRVLKARNAPRRNDVIPPNMLSWTLAVVLVLLAFRFADSAVPGESEAQTQVAVAASGLLLGMLVLATQSVPFSQMVGALRIENAIALFELGGGAAHESLGVRIAQLVVYALSVSLFAWYLRTLASPETADPPEAVRPPL